MVASLSVSNLAGCGSKLNVVSCASGSLGPVCPDGSGASVGVHAAIMRSVARGFGLRHDESCAFADGFALYERLVKLAGDKHRKDRLQALHDESRHQIDGAMGRLRDAIAGQPSDQLGSRYVRRIPAAGARYVVFSDHHYTFKGHRTNFFEESGNLQIYVDALDAYREAGFTVIENGDVEDLVIFDPTWLPEEVQARKCMDLAALQARRLETRLTQLDWILTDPVNAPLIAAYQRLDAEKRLIRIAGNHDYDNQRPEFFAKLQRVYPNLDLPWDIVLLERTDGSTSHAIMHGHQFDLATNPTSAPRFGETISETLGLYCQGPDRNWRWLDDGVEGWAVGREPFLANLAIDKVALTGSVDGRIRGKDDPITYDIDLNPGGAETKIREFLAGLEGELFESTFKQSIAWHYFKSANPANALRHEVLSGDRFFKFQLLDEVWIKQQLLEVFPDVASRPTLILGHTHEVRLDSWDPTAGGTFEWYINSGSAGRFQNLIWGVEVVDGVASLISWSRAHPPNGKIERRVWRSLQHHGNGWVQAADQSQDLAVVGAR